MEATAPACAEGAEAGFAGFCAGEILWEGTDVLQLAKDARRKLAGEEIAMVFQNAGASFCPVRTIGSQLYESVCAHRAWSYDEFRERAEALMVQGQPGSSASSAKSG